MSAQARVYVNDVEVGLLPMQTYEEIRRSVQRDPRLYLKCLIDYTSTYVRNLRMLVAALPWLLLVAAIVILYKDPETVTLFVGAVQAADPAQITAGLNSATRMLVPIIAVSSMGMAIFPGLFAVRNAFNDAVCDKARSFLKVAAVGDVRICFCEPETEEAQAA